MADTFLGWAACPKCGANSKSYSTSADRGVVRCVPQKKKDGGDTSACGDTPFVLLRGVPQAGWAACAKCKAPAAVYASASGDPDTARVACVCGETTEEVERRMLA